jgi:hypothetical protein
MMVPALERDTPPPPKPSGRLDGFAKLEMVPSHVVAVISFSDPTTEEVTRGYARMLKSLVEVSPGSAAAQMSALGPAWLTP